MDKSQISKGRHSKKKHQITVSLINMDLKEIRHQFKKIFSKNPLPTLPVLCGIAGE